MIGEWIGDISHNGADDWLGAGWSFDELAGPLSADSGEAGQAAQIPGGTASDDAGDVGGPWSEELWGASDREAWSRLRDDSDSPRRLCLNCVGQEPTFDGLYCSRACAFIDDLPPDQQEKLSDIRQEIDSLLAAALGIAEAENIPSTNGRLGSFAHGELEYFIKELNKELQAEGSPFSVLSEQFFYSDGREADRRAEDSRGIDVLITYGDDPLLGIDLKSGRGWSPTEHRKIENWIRADVEQKGPWVP